MATTPLARASNRIGHEVVLFGSLTPAAGSLSEEFTLPAGFGPCLIEELNVRETNIDVIRTTVETYGVTVFVRDPSGAVVDVIGTEFWKRTDVGANALGAETHLKPRNPVFWQQHESLMLVTANPDSDATPTGVLAVRVRVYTMQQS